jgi:hypothetical protein
MRERSCLQGHTEAAAADDLRASRGSAIRSRPELLLWKSSCDGAAQLRGEPVNLAVLPHRTIRPPLPAGQLR